MVDILNVLKFRNTQCEPGREIYILEEESSDGYCLKAFLLSLINLSIKDVEKKGLANILPYRLGILYKFISGHVTPLLIEFRDEEHNDFVLLNSESQSNQRCGESRQSKKVFRIFSTDSRAFDVQEGEALKQVILSLPAFHSTIEVYALGLDESNDDAKKNTIRQYSDDSCPVFSAVDLEILLKQYDLIDYFNPAHLQKISDRCYQITLLPPNMMLYCQSIKGRDEDNRRGLKHYIHRNPDKAVIPFTFLERTMSMDDIFSVQGYWALLNGISQSYSPFSKVEQAIEQGYGDELLSIGEKKITLQDLYAWHVRHDKRAFMIDMFVAIYAGFENRGLNISHEGGFKYRVTKLINRKQLCKHALNFNEYGPKTDLLPFIPDASVEENLASMSTAVAAEGLDEVVDGVISLLSRAVLARSPDLSLLLNQEEAALFRPSPLDVSMKVSSGSELSEWNDSMPCSFTDSSFSFFTDPSPTAPNRMPELSVPPPFVLPLPRR